MKRGRPTGSSIRQNILEILYHLGRGYGYEIAKIYNGIFPQVTQRSIYYHLRKGLQTGEIAVHKVEREKGSFSWGDSVEKTYYMLSSMATPQGKAQVKEFLQKWRRRAPCGQKEPREAVKTNETPASREDQRREPEFQLPEQKFQE